MSLDRFRFTAAKCGEDPTRSSAARSRPRSSRMRWSRHWPRQPPRCFWHRWPPQSLPPQPGGRRPAGLSREGCRGAPPFDAADAVPSAEAVDAAPVVDPELLSLLLLCWTSPVQSVTTGRPELRSRSPIDAEQPPESRCGHGGLPWYRRRFERGAAAHCRCRRRRCVDCDDAAAAPTPCLRCDGASQAGYESPR